MQRLSVRASPPRTRFCCRWLTSHRRHIVLETGVLPQANGSCRVSSVPEGTVVIGAVKARAAAATGPPRAHATGHARSAGRDREARPRSAQAGHHRLGGRDSTHVRPRRGRPRAAGPVGLPVGGARTVGRAASAPAIAGYSLARHPQQAAAPSGQPRELVHRAWRACLGVASRCHGAGASQASTTRPACSPHHRRRGGRTPPVRSSRTAATCSTWRASHATARWPTRGEGSCRWWSRTPPPAHRPPHPAGYPA